MRRNQLRNHRIIDFILISFSNRILGSVFPFEMRKILRSTIDGGDKKLYLTSVCD